MSRKTELFIPDTSTDTDRTTQQYVYERLRYAIMVGAIQPGTALTMRGLAEAMDLSPTPVREAVRRLSSENAILIRKNRRIAIPRMTSGRFEELVAMRIHLEVHAAERALPYVADVKIAEMKGFDDRMDQAIAERDLNALTTLNHSFHRTLYTINPDQVAMPLIESLWLQLGPFQRQVIELLDEFYEIDRHKEILSALTARDAVALARATRRDIQETVARAGRKLLAAESTAS
ncbi:GntR family transcriptional regulator [Granulosicoccus sp. 3-233]|uniref:GntR family transcriptional regulator n=1 Tax=Granulosicoccus sp. 3-233 TaxID=3417969 RepID=UPI003D33D421